MKNVLKLFLISDLSAEIWAAIEPPIADYQQMSYPIAKMSTNNYRHFLQSVAIKNIQKASVWIQWGPCYVKSRNMFKT